MHITMVKKRLANGEACRKCIQAEELLQKRGHWERISEVVWAEEQDPNSPGMKLAREYEVEVAPFYLVRQSPGDPPTVFLSALKLIKAHFKDAPRDTGIGFDLEAAQKHQNPRAIIAHALEVFGSDCVIAFSGAEDVALIDLAIKTGLPFSVIVVDTGRLHPATYRFVEKVRTHYGIEINVTSPDALAVEQLVLNKGLFSFYEDGHKECCHIRKVEPLRRALGGFRAWITGQRRDQNAETRGSLPTVEVDETFQGSSGPLIKFNPLASWDRDTVWAFIHQNGVPYNELQEQGYRSIGCEPCTRPVSPGQHDRAGRWWWEEDQRKECGLHVKG